MSTSDSCLHAMNVSNQRRSEGTEQQSTYFSEDKTCYKLREHEAGVCAGLKSAHIL